MGDRLITGGADRIVRVWPERPYPIGRRLVPTKEAHRLVYSADGSRLAIATWSGTFVLPTEDESGPKLVSQHGSSGTVGLAMNTDGSRVAIAVKAGAWVVDARTGADISRFEVASKITCMSASSDLARIALGDESGTVHLFAGGALVEERPMNDEGTLSIQVSPDGEYVATVGMDKVLRLRRWTTDEEITVASVEGLPLEMAFSPDSKRFAFSDRVVIQVLSTDDGAQELWVPDDGSWVTSLAFSADSRSLAAGMSASDQHAVWLFEDLRAEPVVLRSAARPAEVAFSPDGDRLLATEEGHLSIWFGAAEPPRRLAAGTGPLRAGRFSSAGDIMAWAEPGAFIVADGDPGDRSALLARTETVTNLRVCRGTLGVVPVALPADDPVWAPPSACETH